MKFVRVSFVVLAALCLKTEAKALGLELGESREQLMLDYQVSVTDHKTGRVTVIFTLKNEGRMKPLTSVDLSVPSEDGTGKFHLVTSLQLSGEEGAKSARIHIHKDWLKNANISLKTWTLDGKQQLRTWYYHVVPLAKFVPEKNPAESTSDAGK